MKKLLSLATFATSLIASSAFAQEGYESIAKPWQLNFQAPASPVMERLYDMHTMLLYIITAISLFVLALMVFIALRFNSKANPVPSKVTHNTMLEIVWTALPIIILFVIAIPSIRLHYYMQKVVEPEMTLKVVGYQWYWHYEYPDQGGFGYDSYIKKGNDVLPTEHRLLAVDNHVVVPIDTKVRVLVTGADVIHSWAMPAFGVKRDGVPGRLNETWFEATKLGRFYGQCSELCGVGHGFMPIVLDVVSKEDFAAWVKKKQQEAGINPAAQPAGKAPTTPNATSAAPLAKPETAEDKSHEPRQTQEKARSKATGEGKPEGGAANYETPRAKGAADSK